MLTQASYESKHISGGLSPPDVYYRPGSFVFPFLEDSLPAVDEDDLAFNFGLVAVGVDEEGVTLFDYPQEPFVRLTGTLKPEPAVVGCVLSLQRQYEPWPDLGWGTHAVEKRYDPNGPWTKVVRRSTLRKKRLQRRRRVVQCQVLENKAFSRGCEMLTTKPGSHYRSGNKHRKDEERRERPRKKVNRKRHRRLFDSTLGYPGEGPPRGQRGRWRPLPAPECYRCRLNKGCAIRGHWHEIVREAKRGAPRRLLERKQRELKLERGDSKQKYYRCSVDFPLDCSFNEHFHDGKQLAQEHPPESKVSADFSMADFERRLAGLELPQLEEAPVGPLSWADQGPEDYAPTRVHEPHLVFRERVGNTFDDPLRVEAAFGGADHKHAVQPVPPVARSRVNYCELCAEDDQDCDTPYDDLNVYTYAECPDCRHQWRSHKRTMLEDVKYPVARLVLDPVPPRDVDGFGEVPVIVDEKWNPPVVAGRDIRRIGRAPVIVGENWGAGVVGGPRRVKVPILVENCGVVRPKRRDLWPTVDSFQVFEDQVVKFDTSKLNLEYVVDVPNHNHVETRILYQAGEPNEIACCNPCFSLFSLMPCTTTDDVVLVNEWQAMLVSEIQEAEATNMPAIRFRGFSKLFAKRRMVPGVNNFVKFFTHATRSPIYTNLLHVLMRRKEITNCTLLRGDGSTVTYISSLAYYVAGRLVRADGYRYFDEWANNSSILLNTIIALLNQLYIRDVRLALAVPPTMSNRPAFQRTGLYLRFREAMAPIVSLHRNAW